MAERRLNLIKEITIITISEEARELAKKLVLKKAVPEKASADALHIAIASVERIEFLATWNFKHIANALMQAKIEEVIRNAGLKPSQICTLEELLGE